MTKKIMKVKKAKKIKTAINIIGNRLKKNTGNISKNKQQINLSFNIPPAHIQHMTPLSHNFTHEEPTYPSAQSRIGEPHIPRIISPARPNLSASILPNENRGDRMSDEYIRLARIGALESATSYSRQAGLNSGFLDSINTLPPNYEIGDLPENRAPIHIVVDDYQLPLERRKSIIAADERRRTSRMYKKMHKKDNQSLELEPELRAASMSGQLGD